MRFTSNTLHPTSTITGSTGLKYVSLLSEKKLLPLFMPFRKLILSAGKIKCRYWLPKWSNSIVTSGLLVVADSSA